jgi:LysM domain
MVTSGRSAPLRRAAALLAMLGLEAAGVLALHWLGHFHALQVDWERPVHWLLASPVQDVFGALLRLVGLAMAYWLLASSLLYLLAGLTRLPAAARAVGWFTLPLVRRVADHAVAVTLATSMVGGGTLAAAGPAAASPTRGLGPAARVPGVGAPQVPGAQATTTTTTTGPLRRPAWRPQVAGDAPRLAEPAPGSGSGSGSSSSATASSQPSSSSEATTTTAPTTSTQASTTPSTRAPSSAEPTTTTATTQPPTTTTTAPTTTEAPGVPAPSSTRAEPSSSAPASTPAPSTTGPPAVALPPTTLRPPAYRFPAAGPGGGTTSTTAGPTTTTTTTTTTGHPPTSGGQPGGSQPGGGSGGSQRPRRTPPHKVEPGDNFWSISRRHLAAATGRSPSNAEIATYWQRVIAANRGWLGGRDPDLIFPGEEVTLPPVSEG